MANLAKRYLTPPPTSTCVERLFSQGSNFLTDVRGCLKPDHEEEFDCDLLRLNAPPPLPDHPREIMRPG